VWSAECPCELTLEPFNNLSTACPKVLMIDEIQTKSLTIFSVLKNSNIFNSGLTIKEPNKYTGKVAL